MTATRVTVLNLTQFDTSPVRMRYSFDHMVKPSEDGEELTCVFYITLNGTAHYVKLIGDQLVLKKMVFTKDVSNKPHELELLEAYALDIYDKMKSDEVDVDIFANLSSSVVGRLTELNQLIRDGRPDLDIRTINATGLFATAYPSTEELINGLSALENKINTLEKPL